MSAKRKLYLADLTHTNGGIMALTHPLGTAYVAAYCAQQFKDSLEVELFKFPLDLMEKLEKEIPDVLAFSNYSWNLELSYSIASHVKKSNPNTLIVFGGPNFPTLPDEQEEFLREKSNIDFYIQLEGEIAFADLIRNLINCSWSQKKLKSSSPNIVNSVFLDNNKLKYGPIERIRDVNILPSPYLSGMLDKFFDMPLTPMIETTRGCPFQCSFCADGIKAKTKIFRFSEERVSAELHYIGDRAKKTDEIIITDLNFGMYEQDIKTAEVIAEIQIKKGWPISVKGSAGKNKQDRIINVAKILKGSWIIGASIQSTDPDVLRKINRSNISLDAYQNFLTTMNDLRDDASTYTEIIVGLPGDTKAKHFQSLKDAVESGVINVKSYQAMVLLGTEMASAQSRSTHGLVTKHRIMAGGAGSYRVGTTEIRAVEVQELIVANSTMTFEDYISCRKMDFILEAFYNQSPYSEILSSFASMGFSIFKLLEFVHSHPEIYPLSIRRVFETYEFMTRRNLYDTACEAKGIPLEEFELYRSGKIGFNETLECKKLLYLEMDESIELLTNCIKMYLKSKNIYTELWDSYFSELGRFVRLRKQGITSDEAALESIFHFDFVKLDAKKFNFANQEKSIRRQKTKIKFFHEDQQRKHIEKALKQYENHAGGIARFFYSQNLNTMYRRVSYA